ncbi:MAG: 4-hydroxy-tetrahydrodipicolinate reductase [Candidatus Lokiarchaeota archaeon]|nr:4-hydroxy-tetrahydrodipicolinate reductase [Candidatus Lokiarchaeota archaeon]
MINLLILGPTGTMGKLISTLALEDPEINVVAACDISNIGDRLDNFTNIKDANNIFISDIDNIQNIIEDTKPNVVVDFTIAKATEKNCLICAKNGVRSVIGSTGLSEEFLENLEKLIKENNAPSVVSSNMAIGVNIFFKMLSIMSPYLKDWDIEIIESHHNRKQDSPSGTAITAGKIISSAIGCDFNNVAKFGRDKGINKRKVGALNEIGFHSIRAGDISGDHIILYAGAGERIEFKHQAHNRLCFANGAIKAIKFIIKAKKNKIYTSNEVLGL